MKLNINIAPLLNNIYFLVVLLFSGYATSFYRSDIGVAFLFCLSILVLLLKGIKIQKQFFILIILWTLYSLFTMVFYKDIYPSFYLRHVTYFTSGYILLYMYKDNFFYKYENILYKLALISLVFYSWQILSYGSLNYLMNTLDVSGYQPSMQHGDNSKNIIVYTLHHNHILRNCGFTWEPGPFSVFLSIAIYFNILRTGFRIVGNRKLIVLVVAVITTLSTTGILILIVIFAYSYFSENKMTASKLISSVFLIIVFGYLFFSLDFLFPKIQSLYKSGDADVILQQARLARDNQNFSFGRFAVFQIGWKDFMNHPFIGYAGASYLTFMSQVSLKVNIVSGLATIFGMYGIFWVILAGIYLTKSSKKIANMYQSNSKYLLVFIILISLVSFHAQTFFILYVPMFLFMMKNNVVERFTKSEN